MLNFFLGDFQIQACVCEGEGELCIENSVYFKQCAKVEIEEKNRRAIVQAAESVLESCSVI